jgi:hypothetical protein
VGWGLSGGGLEQLDQIAGRVCEKELPAAGAGNRFAADPQTRGALCDKVREVCPALPGGPEAVHWSTADPSGQSDGVAAFRRTAAELAERVGFLLYQLGGRAAAA